MGQTVGELIVVIKADNKQFKKELAEMKKSLKNTEKSLSGIGGGLKNFIGILGAAGIAGTAINGIRIFSQEAINLAFQMEGLENAFNKMAGESAPELLVAIQKASAGTVSGIDAIAAANKAMLLGIDQESLPQMMEIARASAQAMGTSVTDAFNDIAIGLGRQSKLILDNLGIIVNVESSYEKYAVQLGKTASQLTDAEKKQGFINETMRIGAKNVENMGGALDTNREAVQKLQARWKDFQTDFGENLSDNIGGMAQWIEKFISIDENMDNIVRNLDVLEGKEEKAFGKGILSKLADFAEALGVEIPDELRNLQGTMDDINEATGLASEKTEELVSAKHQETEAVSDHVMKLIMEKNQFGALSKEYNRIIASTSIYTEEVNDNSKAIANGNKLLQERKERLDSIRKAQTKLVEAFGSAKDFEKEKSQIRRGKVEASPEIRKLFGLNDGEVSGLDTPASAVSSGGNTVIMQIENVNGGNAEELADELQRELEGKITT